MKKAFSINLWHALISLTRQFRPHEYGCILAVVVLEFRFWFASLISCLRSVSLLLLLLLLFFFVVVLLSHT